MNLLLKEPVHDKGRHNVCQCSGHKVTVMFDVLSDYIKPGGNDGNVHN